MLKHSCTNKNTCSDNIVLTAATNLIACATKLLKRNSSKAPEGLGVLGEELKTNFVIEMC
ncbi:hypothetical protein BpHYR1_046812 [Brachionus plicatilis]|uniref:Uncharacterized protein n=1 Tax=Brachionus plicatilis TaxID=10195 RepID=A0A3M7RNC1_BRAPC|nr:hypothetical protein BpHYR1_046812 [Brachionus plicatilis]